MGKNMRGHHDQHPHETIHTGFDWHLRYKGHHLAREGEGSLKAMQEHAAVYLAIVRGSPLILLSGFIGNYLNKKISHQSFRVIVLLLIFCIGARLLLKV